MHSPHEDASPPSPDFAHVRAPVVARHARRPAQHIGHERPVEAELGHDCSESAVRGQQRGGLSQHSSIRVEIPPLIPRTPSPHTPLRGKASPPSQKRNSPPPPPFSSLVVQRCPHDQLLVSSLSATAAPAERRTRAARHGWHPLPQRVWGGKCGDRCEGRVAVRASERPDMDGILCNRECGEGCENDDSASF